MVQDERKTPQPAAEGPALPGLIRYDGPPELADAWRAFVRRYAAAASRDQGAAPFSRFHIEQANSLNELAFGENGAARFLERRRILGTRKQLQLPAIPPETGPTAAIGVRALDKEDERQALDKARKDIEPVALALAEATAGKGQEGAEARELFNRINDLLLEQWIEREKAFGLYPPLGLKGDLPQAVRLRRRALLDDVEGKLLSGTLYSLQTPILIKAGHEFVWKKLSAAARKSLSHEDVIEEAVGRFKNALFSYESDRRRFTSHVIGSVQLLAAKGPNPRRSRTQRAMERTQSLDRPFFDYEANDTSTGAMHLPDPAAEQPEDVAMRRERNERLQTALEALTVLTERERNILSLRFGLDGQPPLTLEETGQVFGITKERARQIQATALGKLRDLPIFAAAFAELEGLTDEEQAALSDSSSSGQKSPPSMQEKLAAKERKRSSMTLG